MTFYVILFAGAQSLIRALHHRAVPPVPVVLRACARASAAVEREVRTIASIHNEFTAATEGSKLRDAVVTFDAVVVDSLTLSPRLVFLRLRARDAEAAARSEHHIDLLLKERDGYLTEDAIKQVCSVATPGVRLRIDAFVERLSSFESSPFAQLPAPPSVCVHAIAVTARDANEELLFASARGHSVGDTAPGRRRAAAPMPSADGESISHRKARARGGAANDNRGAKFAEWLVATFGMSTLLSGTVLDVAGGAGQVAFELGVRRGVNTTTIDPRPLRLDASQQRTVRYLQRSPTARMPTIDTHGAAASASAWDGHFPQVGSLPSHWRVGVRGHGEAASNVTVGHMGVWFDESFAAREEWRTSSVVVGMHPDEATEAIVDLALAHRKPFAVVPCCVFWRTNLGRIDPNRDGGTVKSWEQFCDYLASKSEVIERARLPMRGRNEVLFATFRDG